MNKIDWQAKLSSRKLWALLGGFVSSLLVAFNVDDNTVVQVTGVITAFGSVAVYIFAEASVDKARAKNENKTE